MTVYWQQGDAHGLVWDQGLALISGEVGLDAATSLWLTCRAGVTMGQFLEELARVTATSLLSLPGFVVALEKGPATHMAARGEMLIEVSSESGDEQISGAQVTTWLERQVGGVADICLRVLSAGDAPGRPLEAGLVPADALRRGPRGVVAAVATAASAGREAPVVVRHGADPLPEPSAVLIEVPAVAKVVVAEPAVLTPPVVDAPLPEPALPEAPRPEVRLPEAAPPAAAPPQRSSADEQASADESTPAAPRTPLAHETATWALPEPALVESPLARTELPDELAPRAGLSRPGAPVAPAQPAAPSEFEMLWGATSAVDINQASALLPDPDAPAPKPDQAARPGSGPATTEALAPVISLDQIDDHDSMTVMSLDPPTGESSQPVNAQAVNAGSVVAILCPLGHANPPHRSGCRSCGAPLLGEPLRVPRPALGWMRTAEGERIDLTAPVIIGRKPTVTRLQGLEMPRLVAVPHGHVSSNHLEIRMEGWNVMAVDLHSRNGTLLRRQGEPPVRLPERPAMLVAGDVLDLGHGVQFSFHELP